MSNSIHAVLAQSAKNSGPSEGSQSLPLVLTRNQTATALCCCAKHVDHLTRRGLLPRVRLGRSIRYRREAVVAALKRLEGGAA